MKTDYSSPIGRIIRLPLRIVPDGLIVPIISGLPKGMRWITGTSTHGCWIGSYERKTQLALSRLINKDDIFFDIGANVGFFTLVAARLVGHSGYVYSFEPLPRNLCFLRKHKKINGLNNVSIIASAIGDFDGFSSFQDSLGPSMARLCNNSEIKVVINTLDSLMRKGIVSPPSVLKIDVEGAEVMVLQGAEDTLRKYHPAIFLSAHGYENQLKCQKILYGIGYEINLISDTGTDGNYDNIAL